jgi:hypothetical protein
MEGNKKLLSRRLDLGCRLRSAPHLNQSFKKVVWNAVFHLPKSKFSFQKGTAAVINRTKSAGREHIKEEKARVKLGLTLDQPGYFVVHKTVKIEAFDTTYLAS